MFHQARGLTLIRHARPERYEGGQGSRRATQPLPRTQIIVPVETTRFVPQVAVDQITTHVGPVPPDSGPLVLPQQLREVGEISFVAEQLTIEVHGNHLSGVIAEA